MKKFTIVLLIAVLAMTSAFANFGITLGGSVKADYSYDFDTKKLVYSEPNAALTAAFVLDGATKDNKLADGLRAEVVSTLAWVKPTTTITSKTDGTAKDITLTDTGKFTLTLTSFDVKYQDIWSLNLMTAKAVGGFAVSPIDYITKSKVKYYYNDTVALSTNALEGVTFNWLKEDFIFTGSATGVLSADASKEFYLGVQTHNYSLNDNFKLQGAGYFNYAGGSKFTTDKWIVGASLKFGYANADSSMTYTVSSDNNVSFDNVADTVKYDVDAQFKAVVYPATVNVYYAKNATQATYNTTGFKNLLSADLTFDMAKYFHAPIVASFTGLNLLNQAKILSTSFKMTIAEKYVLTAYGTDLLSTTEKYTKAFADTDEATYYAEYKAGQKVGVTAEVPFGPVTVDFAAYTKIAAKAVGGSVAAEYENQWFTATGSVAVESKVGKEQKGAAFKDIATLTVAAGVEAEDTVIKNATVALNYASGKNLLKEKNVGSLTASVLVEF